MSIACALVGLVIGFLLGLALSFVELLFFDSSSSSCILLPLTTLAGIAYGAKWGYEISSDWYRFTLIQCQSCGYSLMGGAGEQCPECGYPISEEQIELREAWKR